jgi:epoxyqueuosine reductase QueG
VIQNQLLDRIRSAGRPFGLNLVAAVPVDRYDRGVTEIYRVSGHWPDAKSIVVIANGGGDFWRAYLKHASLNPGWSSREHPLDDFTKVVIESWCASPFVQSGELCAVTYPFIESDARLDFMQLARVAGIAGPSVLGVVINPEYGPWIAFRAALLMRARIDSPGSAVGFDPCPSCVERSCMPSCPVGAIGEAGWNIPSCVRHRVEVEADCAPQCHARVACVIGPEHRYPDDELAYHQGRALRSMRNYYFRQIKTKSRTD